jgi:Inner membrane component domain
MSLISLLLNLLWIVFGGLWMALGWVIAAVEIYAALVVLRGSRGGETYAAGPAQYVGDQRAAMVAIDSLEPCTIDLQAEHIKAHGA